MMINLKISESEDCEEVTLAGDLTVEHAAEIKAAILHAFLKGKGAMLHFEEVAKIDLSFLQTLKAAQLTADGQNIPFRLLPPLPGKLLKAIEDAGFSASKDITCLSGHEQFVPDSEKGGLRG